MLYTSDFGYLIFPNSKGQTFLAFWSFVEPYERTYRAEPGVSMACPADIYCVFMMVLDTTTGKPLWGDSLHERGQGLFPAVNSMIPMSDGVLGMSIGFIAPDAGQGVSFGSQNDTLVQGENWLFFFTPPQL